MKRFVPHTWEGAISRITRLDMQQVRPISRLLVLGLSALVLAACGGGGPGGSGGGGTVAAGVLTCTGAPLAPEPQLPAAFPKPEGLTYVESNKQGPTTVVGGYYEGGLEDAYTAYKDGFEQAGYAILFDEKEKEDAEVSYKDAAEVTSGQVALRAKCNNGNVSVRITNRPA
jgi:hypothetical protein